MALHVSSVAAAISQSLIPAAASRDQFWSNCHTGQILCCSGRGPIPDAIKAFTHSPWTHVGMVWAPCDTNGNPYSTWLLIEATWPTVTLTPLSRYIDQSQWHGDLVLCDRIDPIAHTPIDQRDAIDYGLTRIGERYAIIGLVVEAVHELDPNDSPSFSSPKSCFCSGLQRQLSTHTTCPYPMDGTGEPTPEMIYIHPSTVARIALPLSSR